MKKTIVILTLLGASFLGNAQDQIVNGTLTVRSNSDGITTFQTLDDKWLYTQWKDKSNIRKAYMGFDPNLENFRINLENGADKFTINGGYVGIGNYLPDAPLHISSNSDAVLTLQTNDNTWLYTNWKDKDGVRKAYMGLNKELSEFRIGLENGVQEFLVNGGNVGIGTYNTGSWKLAVNGKIRAKEIKVETGWSDFVFYEDYKLPTLTEVETHIQQKGHLKDIPSGKEVSENGILLGEMNSKLLQKIEELTLYTIAQEKQLKTQNSKVENLEEEIKKLKAIVGQLIQSKE